MARSKPMLLCAATVVAVLGLATSALAQTAVIAKISFVAGEVLVNQGHGFRPARAGMLLHAGDRVISPHAGRALITYAAGCTATVDAGSMTMIDQALTCRPHLIKADTGPIGEAPTGGVAHAGTTSWLSNPVTIGGVSVTKGYIALAAVGAGVGGAAAAGSFSPASP